MPDPASPAGQAAAASAAPQLPVAQPLAHPAPPPEALFAGNSFHEFSARARERAEAQRAIDSSQTNQNTPPANAPQQTPVSRETPPDPTQARAPEKQPDPNALPVDPNAPPKDPNALPQASNPEQAAAKAAAEAAFQQKFSEWRQVGGDIPEELAKVPVRIPGKDGRPDRWEPMGEVVAGFQRRDDSTRIWEESRQRVQVAESRLKQHEQFIDATLDKEKGGQSLYDVYMQNKGGHALEQLFSIMTKNREADMLHAEAAMIAVARRYNIQDPNDYRLKEARDTTLAERRQMREDQALRAVSERERAQMRQTQQTTQQTGRNQEYSNHVRAQLDQLRPRALDAVGLGPNQQGQYDPEHVALFTRKLQAHVEQNDIQHLTPQVCLYAARMVIDHLDRERASAGGQGGAVPPNPQPGNRGFSPGAAGGGQGSRPAQDNGWDGTTAGFEKRYNLKPWQREQ